MATLARKRTRLLVLMTIVLVSAACMLWLFWRFPLITTITTIIVIVGFGVSARVARLIDSDPEIKRRDSAS